VEAEPFSITPNDKQGKILASVYVDSRMVEGLHPVITKKITDSWGPLQEADLAVPAEHAAMEIMLR
jgi:hypothetical protein